MSYTTLPLEEYAKGAVEYVLANGEYSHVALYSERQHAGGGLYLSFEAFAPNTTDVETKARALANTVKGYQNRGQFLKLIDLSEEVDEQLVDINEVYQRVVGRPYNSSGDRYY